MTITLVILFILGLFLFSLGYFFRGPTILRGIILTIGMVLLVTPILAWIYLLTILINL